MIAVLRWPVQSFKQGFQVCSVEITSIVGRDIHPGISADDFASEEVSHSDLGRSRYGAGVILASVPPA